MTNEIEVGDIVSVNFNNAQITLSRRAEVICVPTSAGDSWIFEDKHTYETSYVSEGCTITLIEKGAKQ